MVHYEKLIHVYLMFSVSTNLPSDTKCFIRKSSDPKSSSELIADFINHLFLLEQLLNENIPEEIGNAIEKLESENIECRFSKHKTKIFSWITTLKRFQTLQCFGFNSGKLISHKLYYSNEFKDRLIYHV